MKNVLSNIYGCCIAIPAMFIGCTFLGIKHALRMYRFGYTIDIAQEKYEIEADNLINILVLPVYRLENL